MLFRTVVKYVRRMPTLELVVHFVWSVLSDALTTEDVNTVVEALYTIATDPETNEEQYNNPLTETE